MASEKHLELSDFIKSVHKSLREQSSNEDFQNVWENHCENKELLRKYAACMKQLATGPWNEKGDTFSRISWTVSFIDLYFKQGELQRRRRKEDALLSRLNIPATYGDFSQRCLRLLDVGSCYNPFKEFEFLDVTAIDIAPACADVLQCDFLRVELGGQFEKCSFDIVVFSLFLEYLPSPEQRYLCCLKAFHLLQYEGLLIIITPDSSHVGANAQLMKAWKYTLATIGFHRVKYEKLKHLHCIGFRKSINAKVPAYWDIKDTDNVTTNKLFIPQDLKHRNVDVINTENTCTPSSTELNFFHELPQDV